jgi:hypothetical protein
MEILEIKTVLGMVLGDNQNSLRNRVSEHSSHFCNLILENGWSAPEVDLANVIESGRKQIAIHRGDFVPRVPEIDGAIESRRGFAETRFEPIRNLTSFFEDGVSDLIF